jgi:hypothetical protein
LSRAEIIWPIRNFWRFQNLLQKAWYKNEKSGNKTK